MGNNRTAIIDGDSVLFAMGHGVKLLDENGLPIREDGKRFLYREKTSVELTQAADFYMNNILTNGNFNNYIVYLKGQNTISFRKLTNPDYKSNRPSQAPSWWEFLKNYLQESWGAIVIDDMEVDDAVNITRLQLPDSFIVAIDGDLLGLEGTHYNWKTQEWITVNKFQEEKKFWSDMICGQTGDNIKGILGKGEKHFNNYVLARWENDTSWSFPTLVFNEYRVCLGEDKGIKEFYKNYISLKILDQKQGFIVPEPIEFKRKELSLI